MPRTYFKVGTKEYVGPTLRDIIEKNKDLRAQYSYEGYMGILRYAGKVGGEFWFAIFFPMRFEESYARSLGHTNARWYKEWKQENVGKTVPFAGKGGTLQGGDITIAGPQPTPFFASGGSRASIEKSYRVEVVAKGTNLTIRVVFRLGMIAFHGRDAFLKVPAQEYARVVQEVERTIRLRVLSQQQTEEGIDPRILGQDSRSKIDADLRPSFMKERAAL